MDRLTGHVVLSRNEAGSVVLQAIDHEGKVLGVATYRDERDWRPALDRMMAAVL